MAELIKLALDKEEQLQASNTDQLQRLLRSKLLCQGAITQNARCQFNAQLADMDEEDEGTDTSALITDMKSKSILDPMKAHGKYPFPFANNKSKKIPPRPC
jgi:hypothetical protein